MYRVCHLSVLESLIRLFLKLDISQVYLVVISLLFVVRLRWKTLILTPLLQANWDSIFIKNSLIMVSFFLLRINVVFVEWQALVAVYAVFTCWTINIIKWPYLGLNVEKWIINRRCGSVSSCSSKAMGWCNNSSECFSISLFSNKLCHLWIYFFILMLVRWVALFVSLFQNGMFFCLELILGLDPCQFSEVYVSSINILAHFVFNISVNAIIILFLKCASVCRI